MGWTLALVGLALLVAPVAAVLVAAVPRDDVPNDPDVVVVLGGAGVERAEHGIELAREHDAVLVLSSSAAHYGEHDLGLRCDVDTRCVAPVPENTMGEARLIADLADEQGWDHVTVVTAIFHTSRTRLLFRQCLDDRVSVVGAPDSDHRSTLGAAVREGVGILAALTVQRAC